MITKTPRIEVVDALRGFAVMVILLAQPAEWFRHKQGPLESLWHKLTWIISADRLI